MIPGSPHCFAHIRVCGAPPLAPGALVGNFFTEICSGAEAGSYSRIMDLGYHSTLGLRAIRRSEKKWV